MAKRAMRPPPPLVLRLLRALYEVSEDGAAEWVLVDSLPLRVDRIRLDQAIVLAALSGWVKVAGNPPERLMLTEAGSSLLKPKVV